MGSGSSTSGLVRVRYGVGANSPMLSLGIPQTCTSHMARRDLPTELPSWSQPTIRLCVALFPVMIQSVYESRGQPLSVLAKDPAEFITTSHATTGCANTGRPKGQAGVPATRARSSGFTTLPVGFRGNSSTKTNWRGTL